MKKEDLIKAKQTLTEYNSLLFAFGKYSKIYSMTTENVYGFLKNCRVKDANVLTVAGSGDQLFNCYLMGAKNVTCFDINPITYDNIIMKKEAIKTFNFEDFLAFFGIYNRKYNSLYNKLDYRLFYKIQDNLNKNNFFKMAFNSFVDFNEEWVYFSFDNKLSLMQKINNYVDPDSYQELRSIIADKEINFIESDVTDLPDKLGNGKFDLILLSNISDYINTMYDGNYFLRYRDVIDALIDHLNPEGIIQVGYIYSNYKPKTYNILSDFVNGVKRKVYFPTSLYHTMLVDSFNDDGTKDKVITYQKY